MPCFSSLTLPSPPSPPTHTHQITTYDRLRAGWFSVCVTSYPDKIHEALAASLAVLRDIAVSPITPRELMRAKRTLITR